MTRGRAARAVTVAGAGVLLASMDTYVVVLALPPMLGDLGIGLEKLQLATPVITGFLLGYVVVMPLLGRLSDVRGRRQVLLLCLAVFAAGSVATASAHDLGSAVAGRALQGLGGGGLVPVTLALVADHWDERRRGLPLGVVGAVQELGSVLGPLYGALILSVWGWRSIFWLNLPLCALVALGLLLTLRERTGRPDSIASLLGAGAIAAGALAIVAPEQLRDSVTIGTLYAPLLGLQWLSPIAVAAAALGAACVIRGMAARRRRSQPRTAGALDIPGAALLGAALGCVVLAFATADPSREVVGVVGVVALPAAALAAGALWLRERRARAPLLSPAMLGRAGAGGALLVNVAVGAALMSALLDIPILARATVAPDSQLGAAAVLLRLLAGVPVGAVLGGIAIQRVGNAAVATLGLALCAAMFAVMSRWTAGTLAAPFGAGWLHPSDPVLVLCGVGFGLAIAPVNASMLHAVAPSDHGVASALVVVARMVGMVAGVSALTAIGLRAFFDATSRLPSAITLCPQDPLHCSAYDALVKGAVVDEVTTVCVGAAVCAGAAALLAALLLRGGGRTAAAAA